MRRHVRASSARLAFLFGLCAAAAPASKPTLLPDAAEEPQRGRWVLDAKGKGVPPESFRRGLQSSGLLWHDGALWSLGDQRSQHPGKVFRIAPETGRLRERPWPILPPASGVARSPHFNKYRAIPNVDLEGLTAHPGDKTLLFAVTEDKDPWIVGIRFKARESGPTVDGSAVLAGNKRLQLDSLTALRFPEGLEPWRGSTNFRIEGIAISDEPEDAARTVYLAYERAADNLPRVLTAGFPDACGGRQAQLRELPIDFAALPRRADKSRALLNLNDIQFLRVRGRPCLLAVARDQERVLVIDLDARKVTAWIDLELRDPQSRSIHWVSPEGLAIDAKTDRLWIINDPDSVRGNYKLRGSKAADGRFAEYAPLLFEMKLSEVLAKVPQRS